MKLTVSEIDKLTCVMSDVDGEGRELTHKQREFLGELGKRVSLPASHASDCAVHNEPALPKGPCDCGASKITRDQIIDALSPCYEIGDQADAVMTLFGLTP